MVSLFAVDRYNDFKANLLSLAAFLDRGLRCVCIWGRSLSGVGRYATKEIGKKRNGQDSIGRRIIEDSV